ncbi:MAG: hypothetical protein WCH65_08890 [bacterium]
MVNIAAFLLFAVDKNTIPMIIKGKESNAKIHNHRLIKLFSISESDVATQTTPNNRNTRLTKSQRTAIITGENVNHHQSFFFIIV